MKTIQNDYGWRVFVPDAPELKGLLAAISPDGWVVVGAPGSSRALEFSSRDWPVFLRFFGDVQKSLTALGEKS